MWILSKFVETKFVFSGKLESTGRTISEDTEEAVFGVVDFGGCGDWKAAIGEGAIAIAMDATSAAFLMDKTFVLLRAVESFAGMLFLSIIKTTKMIVTGIATITIMRTLFVFCCRPSKLHITESNPVTDLST